MLSAFCSSVNSGFNYSFTSFNDILALNGAKEVDGLFLGLGGDWPLSALILSDFIGDD